MTIFAQATAEPVIHDGHTPHHDLVEPSRKPSEGNYMRSINLYRYPITYPKGVRVTEAQQVYLSGRY